MKYFLVYKSFVSFYETKETYHLALQIKNVLLLLSDFSFILATQGFSNWGAWGDAFVGGDLNAVWAIEVQLGFLEKNCGAGIIAF